MKTSNKILIDRVVGLPISWALNLMARALGRVLRRDHSVTRENTRTIVIAKYVGMGSILQATPLIRSIRAAFPEARLILVTGRGCRRMAERLEFIDKIITVNDSGLPPVVSSSLRTIATLIRERVDLYFDLELYSAYASVMALLSLSRNRVGFFRVSAGHKLGNYTHLMFFNARNPIRYVYLQLGRLVGCQPVDPDRLGRLRIDDGDRAEVTDRLSPVMVGPRGYFVVNPNASDLLLERRWSREKFAELIERLVSLYEWPVVLIGTPAERPYVAGLLDQVRGGRDRVLNLAGELSLGGLFALLDGARCVITNDTGPLHMALAMEAPTVGLFGPGDPGHYGWVAPRVRIVHKPIYCSPCLYEVNEPPCQGNNVCMQRITVEDVLEAVEGVLMAPPGSMEGQEIAPAFFGEPHEGPLGCIVRGSFPQWNETEERRPSAPPVAKAMETCETIGCSEATP
jgi:ADP-heptose:LPS heptosyltransferase